MVPLCALIVHALILTGCGVPSLPLFSEGNAPSIWPNKESATPSSSVEAFSNVADDRVFGRFSQSTEKMYIEFVDGETRNCTGFITEKGYLFTAYHCLLANQTRDDKLTNINTVMFEKYIDLERLNKRKFIVPISPIASDFNLDYAVFFMPQAVLRKSGGLLVDVGVLKRKEALSIIHYPRGYEEMRISRLGCSVIDFDNQSTFKMKHLCSTAKASSGAPVIASDGSVVAMHIEGAKDGVATRNDPNIAVTMSAIANDLERKLSRNIISQIFENQVIRSANTIIPSVGERNNNNLESSNVEDDLEILPPPPPPPAPVYIAPAPFAPTLSTSTYGSAEISSSVTVNSVPY